MFICKRWLEIIMDKRERSVTADVKLLEDNIIEFIAVTEKYVPKEILPNLAKWGVNQPIIYRHEHPAKGWGGQILGRTIKAKVVEIDDLAVLKGKAQMFNNTEMQRMALEYIGLMEEEKTPIQISIGYQEFLSEGKVVDAQIYEYSLTHIPVCKECVVSIGETEMEETKQKELEDKISKGENTINELQEALDSMSGKNKNLTDSNTELETKIHEYEEKYVAQKDEVSKLNTRVQELEDGMRFATIKPKVDEIVKLYEDPDLYTYFKAKSLEKDGETWLDKKLEEKKKKSHPAAIATETIKELQGEVGQRDKEEVVKLNTLEAQKFINSSVKDENMRKILNKLLKK